MTPKELALYSTMMGVLISAALSSTIFIINKIKLYYKLEKIKKMIIKEYVNPLKKIKSIHKLKKEIEKKCNRITYLCENEIKYLNSDNQFAIIRMIEYTKQYYKKALQIILKEFENQGFVDTDEQQSSKIKKEQVRKFKKLTEIYEDTLDDYAKLKIESLDFDEDK